MSDDSVNPYVGCTHACRYCYTSFMKRFTGHPEPWGTFLDVKRWPEIRHPERYAGKELFIGSVTDPYLPQEGTFGRTRALLEQLKGSGVRTTCFVSPIFPGLTDGKAIIDRVKGQCNRIWLENLNLRGSYKAAILDYIRERHPQLFPLYQEIYCRGNRAYWERLDAELRDYAAGLGLDYVTNDDSGKRPFDAPPVLVNYFYHEQIKKSARKGEDNHAGTAGSRSDQAGDRAADSGARH